MNITLNKRQKFAGAFPNFKDCGSPSREQLDEEEIEETEKASDEENAHYFEQ